jgi:predicted outer membrane repeat protein
MSAVLTRDVIGVLRAKAREMPMSFARLRVPIVVSAVLGLLGLFVGTADAQVSVPGNYGSIQAAINAVMDGSLPDGTRIDVQPGTYFEVLLVANTSRSMTVRGVGGPSATVVDAGGRNAPALNVIGATGQVAFRGLTFRNAATSIDGGGFLIRESSPSLVDCIFESNSAHNGGGGALFASNATFTGCIIRSNSALHFGGGVYIVQGSRPTFTATDIVGNTSGTGGAGVGNNGAGGGVFAHDSSPSFRGVRIDGNSSKFAGGGLFHLGVFGSSYGRAMLTVEDSEVADNVSNQFPGEPNPAEGGGMHVEDNATATLNRVRILRNRAGTGGGLNAHRGRYDVLDSVIDSNQATIGFGGGVSSSSNFSSPQMPASIINLTTTLVRNNTAALGGGVAVVGDNFSSQKASVSLTSSVVSGNRSQSQGGGMLVSLTILTAANSLIMNNSVTGGDNPYGGGLLIASASAATISATTFADNTAGQHGGGIFVNDNSTIDMSGSHVYSNTSGTRGAGLFVGGGQSGIVQNNIIADNTGPQPIAQINEDACSSVTYPNNLITPTAFSGCSTLASRAPGTDSTSAPRFAKFLAVPSAGTTTTLAWSVARATSVTIDGVGTWNSPNNSPTGTADVTPASSTTFSLTAAATETNGGNYGPVTASFVVVQPPPAPRNLRILKTPLTRATRKVGGARFSTDAGVRFCCG